MNRTTLYCVNAMLFCVILLGDHRGAGRESLPWERPPRKILVDTHVSIQATASNTEIVIAPDASGMVLFAASELQNLLSESLGGKIPLVHGPRDRHVSFVLGVNTWSKSAGIKDGELVRDAFIIRTSGHRIYIVGRDDPMMVMSKTPRYGVWFERGTVFGVYDFLERVAGVRMYFPGPLGTIVPRHRELRIPKMDIYDRPDFTQRRIYPGESAYYTEGNVLLSQNINHSRLRLETEMIPCSHGTNGFKYYQRFGESHPEYFARLRSGERSKAGHLCWSSGIIEELYQDVRSFLLGEAAERRGLPGGYDYHFNMSRRYVDIMPHDGFEACYCDACQKAYALGDADYAAPLIWQRTAEIASRLKKEGISGYVTQMSYPPYCGIPPFELPDNVLVMVARLGPWMKYNSGKMLTDNALIKGWTRKLGHKVWIWNYPNKLGAMRMPGIPQMSPNAYAEYYKELAPWIFGAFAESESDRYFYNYLNYYIFGKVCWNTGIDYRQVLEEHYHLMFGAAADVMKGYYELLEDKWLRDIAGRTVETPEGPVSLPPSDYDLWRKIYSPQVVSDIDRRLRKASELVDANSLESKRIALIRREFYDPMKRVMDQYERQNRAVKGLIHHLSDCPGKGVRLRPFRPSASTVSSELVDTFVRIWRTKEYLAVKFNCAEPMMSSVSARKRPSDDAMLWQDNSVEIFLNPSSDYQTYYHLVINSEGILSDARYSRINGLPQKDYSWSSGAHVQVEKQDTSWTADIRIPLKKLPGLRSRFPANFTRNRKLTCHDKVHELYIWSPFARSFHDLERFGSLSSDPDGNLLLNGDFSLPRVRDRFWGLVEKGRWAGGWYADGTGCSLDYTTYISAPCSMRIEWDGKTWRGTHVQNLIPSRPSLKLNTKYRLSFYVKLDNIRFYGNSTYGGVGVHSKVWSENSPAFPARNFLTGTMDWTYMSFDFTTGSKPGESKSLMLLGICNAKGVAWFDDVRLEEIR